MSPFATLMQRLTATPSLDKLSQFAKDWKQDEADERAEDEARYWAKQDQIAEARENLDGDEEVTT